MMWDNGSCTYCITYTVCTVLADNFVCQGMYNEHALKSTENIGMTAMFLYVQKWVKITIYHSSDLQHCLRLPSHYTGPLILRDGAILHIWPQIASDRVIYR